MKGELPEGVEAGCAGMLCYLRDLFTITDREQYDRAEILIILESISRDSDWFPTGIGVKLWGMEDEEILA